MYSPLRNYAQVEVIFPSYKKLVAVCAFLLMSVATAFPMRNLHLNYIVDFTEADFAKKLVEQINSEIPESVTLSLEIIQQVAQKMGTDATILFVELLTKKYVDLKYNIIPENKSSFFEEYPLFKSGLESGKVRDRNSKPNHPVKIRKARFEELRELWEKLNQRYTIWYEPELNIEN